MLISRTPPSNVSSVLKAFLKLTCAGNPLMWRLGLTSSVTPAAAVLGAKAALGALNGFVVEVTHAGSAPEPVDVHPAGKAGAVTPSKFSDRGAPGVPAPRRKL